MLCLAFFSNFQGVGAQSYPAESHQLDRMFILIHLYFNVGPPRHVEVGFDQVN